jgi:hypothetical protein
MPGNYCHISIAMRQALAFIRHELSTVQRAEAFHHVAAKLYPLRPALRSGPARRSNRKVKKCS